MYKKFLLIISISFTHVFLAKIISKIFSKTFSSIGRYSERTITYTEREAFQNSLKHFKMSTNVGKLATQSEQQTLEKTTLSILDDTSISKLSNPNLYNKYPNLNTLIKNKELIKNDKLLLDELTLTLFKQAPTKYYNPHFLPHFQKTVENVLFKELNVIQQNIKHELSLQKITLKNLNTLSIHEQETILKTVLENSASKSNFTWNYNNGTLTVNEQFNFLTVKYKIGLIVLLSDNLDSENEKKSLNFIVDKKLELQLQVAIEKERDCSNLFKQLPLLDSEAKGLVR